jgi:hypothetical protein
VKCAKVVSASREELGQATKIGCASENDVARIARITCALSLEMLSEMMHTSGLTQVVWMLRQIPLVSICLISGSAFQ